MRWAKKFGGKLEYFGPWSDPDGTLLRYREFVAGVTAVKLHLTPAKVHLTPAPDKPPKPSTDLPLFAHISGQWAATIEGRTTYFGVWTDPVAALKHYREFQDAPKQAKVQAERGLTIVALVSKFLNSRRRKAEAWEMIWRMWHEYNATCRRIMVVLGKYALVVDLGPDDFAKLRLALTKRIGKPSGTEVGPVALAGDITRCRAVFNFAFKNTLIDRPVKYGEEFSRPKKLVLRRERKKRGKKLLAAEPIHRLIEVATPQIKAMVYLGINCGLGNADCATLTTDDLDLEGGWINFPRGKTEVDRRCPPWPESLATIQTALASWPTPKDRANAKRVFLTAMKAE
jgi:integrase